MKRLISASVGTFATLLLLSVIFVQATTSTLTETRRSALVNTLVRGQLESGALRFYTHMLGHADFNEGGTSSSIATLDTLGELDRINVDNAVTYLASTQIAGSGGFGAFYGVNHTVLSYDMDFTYAVVDALKTLNALDRIDKTAVVNFVLNRYNQSTGAFHELLTEVDGRQYAMSHFAMMGNSEMAYGTPNIISTYLGVSTLADLDMLQTINTTKTFEWIMSSQASNAAFGPFPDPPAWYTFNVDSDGAGVPYTFAAVEALRTLNRLNTLTAQDRVKIREYLLSAQDSRWGNFWINPEYQERRTSFSYYAITTLSHISELSEFKNAIAVTINDLLGEASLLGTDGSWPVPQSIYAPDTYIGQAKSYGADPYGLFHAFSTDPATDTFYTIQILNATNNLSLLDQPTPRSRMVLANLIIMSFIITVSVISIAWGLQRIRIKKRETSKPKNS